jgi:hypothetical protein
MNRVGRIILALLAVAVLYDAYEIVRHGMEAARYRHAPTVPEAEPPPLPSLEPALPEAEAPRPGPPPSDADRGAPSDSAALPAPADETQAAAEEAQAEREIASAPKEAKRAEEKPEAKEKSRAEPVKSRAKLQPERNGRDLARNYGGVRIPSASELRRKRLEHEIEQAIQNRAIEGVRVSVVGDTVFLRGEVHTERQKLAAEDAARSVNGVERVRSLISVGWRSE